MPTKILNSGASVIVDDEDWDLVDERTWHVFTLVPSGRPALTSHQQRHGREFKLFLHREIAMRMRPDVIGTRFRALPINGDFLDCRRENINVVGQKRGRGRPPVNRLPVGSRRARCKGGAGPTKHPTSDAWAGGYEYIAKNRQRSGGGFRIRKCLNGKPVDE